jgi:hypothetical protein
MARTARNNVDYFPHEAIHGKKMFIIENTYGNDGYAVWFKMLEQLGKNDYHYINIKDDMQKLYLASVFKVSEELMVKIITDLAKIGAVNKDLFEDHGIIFSEKFVESIEDAYKRRNNNCVTLKHLCLHLSIKCDTKKCYCGYCDGTGEKKTPPKKETIEDREQQFYELVKPFVAEFGKDICNSFYLYWTETKPNGKKMAFEMKKTFDVKRRLTTWKNNDYGTSTKKTNYGANSEASSKRSWS